MAMPGVSQSMNSIGDKAAIVGIGQTPFSRSLGRSEFDMAVEAIFNACADAGISPRQIDGVRREIDRDKAGLQQMFSQRDGNCTRTGADVGDAQSRRAIGKMFQCIFDQTFCFRAGD